MLGIFTLGVSAILLLGVWWFLQDKQRYSKYPPGPPRVPLLGCLPFFPRASTPAAVFDKLSEIYGDVVYLKIGLVDAVVFNSFESVTAILKLDKASGRKNDWSRNIYERMLRRNLGIVFSNGSSQKIMRKFTQRTLHEFGFGKAVCMDFVVNQELRKFMSDLKSQIAASPSGIQADELFFMPTISIIWRLVTAAEPGTDKLLRFLELTDKVNKAGSMGVDASVAFPFLWDLFPNWSGKVVNNEINNEIHELMKELIRKHRESRAYATHPECYVDVFLAKIEETREDSESEFTDSQLNLCLMDYFQAGSDSTSKNMAYVLLYMILHPNIQDKVRNEIISEIGELDDIEMSMKTRLPFSYATLLECLRMSNVVPFPPPRKATEDFYFKGYLIKKGTALQVNLEAANMSQSQWTDPKNFRPSRYLTEDGQLDMKVVSNLKTFGDGKRVCIGQSLAESFLFINFASLLRTFELKKVVGEAEPSTTPKIGLTYAPQPFKIQFVQRKCD